MLVYTLQPGYHTSKQKIEEAKYFGIPLYTELARVEKTEAGRMKRGLIFNLDPAESHAYIEQIRMHLDQGEFVKAKAVQNDYREKLWARLDENTKRVFGGDSENCVVLVQTIRDWSTDEQGEKKASAVGAV